MIDCESLFTVVLLGSTMDEINTSLRTKDVVTSANKGSCVKIIQSSVTSCFCLIMGNCKHDVLPIQTNLVRAKNMEQHDLYLELSIELNVNQIFALCLGVRQILQIWFL